MRSAAIALILAAIGSAGGCSNVSGFNSENDLHCQALAFIFFERTKSMPEFKRQADESGKLYLWYGERLSEAGAFENPDKTAAEGADIAEMVNADLEAFSQKMVECADRAKADPRFSTFSGKL